METNAKEEPKIGPVLREDRGIWRRPIDARVETGSNGVSYSNWFDSHVARKLFPAWENFWSSERDSRTFEFAEIKNFEGFERRIAQPTPICISVLQLPTPKIPALYPSKHGYFFNQASASTYEIRTGSILNFIKFLNTFLIRPRWRSSSVSIKRFSSCFCRQFKRQGNIPSVPVLFSSQVTKPGEQNFVLKDQSRQIRHSIASTVTSASGRPHPSVVSWALSTCSPSASKLQSSSKWNCQFGWRNMLI